MRFPQTTVTTCCQIDGGGGGGRGAESGVAFLSPGLDPNSPIRDVEIGKWHSKQCMQIV